MWISLNWRTSTFLHIFMFKTKPWLKTPLCSTVDPIEAPTFLIALHRLQLMPLVRLQRDCVPGGKSEWTSRSYVHGHKEQRRPQGPITGLEQVSVDAGTRRLMRTDVSLPVWPTLCLYVRKEKKEETIFFTTASSSSPTSVSYDGKQFASGIALWLGVLSHLWKCVAGQQLPDDSDGRGVMCSPLINRHWSSNIIHWEMLVSRSDGWQYSLPFTWKSLFPRPSGLMEL